MNLQSGRIFLKALFTRTLKVIVFVSGKLEVFNIMCEQRHGNSLDPFLNGKINGYFYGTYE